MLEKNGKFYARVTEVLQPFADFSHIPYSVLSNKQRIGTNVHDAIHEDILGDFPILEDDERGYFESYKIWEEAIRPKYIQTECRYYNDEKMITGQIDGLVWIQGEEYPVLVDYKTSASESATWPLQGHIYHWMVSHSGTILAPRILFLKLDKKGSAPKVYNYQLDMNIRAQGLKAISDYWEKNKYIYHKSQLTVFS